jgi:TRAP transporter TAXI family solute receptor
MKRARIACSMTAALALLCHASAGIAQRAELDPSAVSEGLRSIFEFGPDIDAIKEHVNRNTVTIITGTIGGTYVQIGADLASVLDDGDKLRILPIVGRGSVQNLADILYLKGIDLGIVRADTLDYLEKKGYASNLKKKLTYVTKLYNEEMHVVAPKSIKKLSDLAGKTVSVDLPNGGTFITAMTVFERLGIKAKFVFIEERLAYEKLRKGEIDAMVAVQGRPSKFVAQIKDDNLHLLPIDYARALQQDYLPAQLTAKDYPALIAPGQHVDTIAVPAILAAHNWPQDSDRYRRVQLFVERFFEKFKEFQQSPFHPKWKEVVLSAPLPGWRRFPAAQVWLDQRSEIARAQTRHEFEQFLKRRKSEGKPSNPRSAKQRAKLFRQFLAWQNGDTTEPEERHQRTKQDSETIEPERHHHAKAHARKHKRSAAKAADSSASADNQRSAKPTSASNETARQQ